MALADRFRTGEFSPDPIKNPDSGEPFDPPHLRWRGVVASRPLDEDEHARNE